MSELVVAAAVVLGAWAWALGVRPGTVLQSLHREVAAPPTRSYVVMRLGWRPLSSIDDISDSGTVVGVGEWGGHTRVPLAWRDGRTTLCSDGQMPGHAVAVDEAGRIACSVDVSMERGSRAFVRHPGRAPIVLQPSAGGGDCRAWDMNAAGMVAGSVVPPGEVGRACVWDASGHLTLLDGPLSCARCINDAGTVAGFVRDLPWRTVARLWVPDGGGYRTVDLRAHIPGQCWPCAINNQGVIVGEIDPGIPFRWDPSSGLRRLPRVCSDRRARAIDINDRGEIVGHGGSYSEAGVDALLWCADGLVNLNDCIDPACGWHLRRATAISNAGLIGCEATLDEHVEAVVLIPRR